MSKNLKTLVCCILALVFVAGTVVAVFADSTAAGKLEVASDEATTEDVSSTTTYIMGDVNLDGEITAADARLALRCSAQLEPSLTDVQLILADVDKSNVILADDARAILRVSAKLDPDFGTIEI